MVDIKLTTLNLVLIKTRNEIFPHLNDDLAPSKMAPPPCTVGLVGPSIKPLMSLETHHIYQLLNIICHLILDLAQGCHVQQIPWGKLRTKEGLRTSLGLCRPAVDSPVWSLNNVKD